MTDYARRPRRKRTLFPPGEAVRLSESSLAQRDIPAFSAGYRLAVYHSAGVVHGDLHAQHMLFEAFTGGTAIIDFADSSIGAVDPDRMFPDIVMAHMTKGASWTRGLLAGYAKTSYLTIERRQPGYTDTVLARAADEIASVARPAEPVFTEAECDALLAPVLDLSDGTPRLTADLPTGVLSPEDRALVAFALLAAGVTGTWRLRAPDPPRGPAERLLSAALTQSPGQQDPNGLLAPAVAVIKLLSRLSGDPVVPRYLAGMTDVHDWLALCLDRPDGSDGSNGSAFINCVRAAQLSLILLQLPYWSLAQLETQELKITARHRRLGWYKAMLAAKPYDERYMQLLTYLGSRITLYERMFAEPAPTEPDVSNLLWSANWRALLLSRTTLRTLLAALRAGTVVEMSEELTVRMVEFMTTKCMRAARDNSAAMLTSRGSARPLDLGAVFAEDRFPQELEETNGLIELVRTERPGLARLSASEQVSALLARQAPLTSHDFDWLVAYAQGPDERHL
ncbi:phosphotransferase [Streptomyces sp. S3(2020)]|nr:phosphotransferase [Streptomyces sp. S3(2020)]NNN30880.1 phosphotransferase [Streptomyces sp. S3(2020)]